MDKILYDSGFHTAESDIDSDYEYEIFSDALFSMDGYAEEDEDSDCCIYTFYTDCIKEYVSLALKYGRLCDIAQHQNFWIKKFEDCIEEEMRSIGDYSYDYDYNIISERKAFLKVYNVY